jgi:hypothetical protein
VKLSENAVLTTLYPDGHVFLARPELTNVPLNVSIPTDTFESIVLNNSGGINPVRFVQPQNVYLNMLSMGAGWIPSKWNKSDPMDVRFVQFINARSK